MLSVKELEDILIDYVLKTDKRMPKYFLEFLAANYSGQYHEMDARNAANKINHEIMAYWKQGSVTKEVFAKLYEARSRRPV